jgi:hypothetical protein
MPRLSTRPVPMHRVTVRIWRDDHEEIMKMASADMEYNQIIRDALHQFVLHAKERMRRMIDGTAA